MHVTYACQNCGAAIHQQFDASSGALECPTCRQRIAIAPDAVEDLRVQRCLVCPSREMFVRKDFPQRLGVALVTAGIVGSSIAWYYASLSWTFGILFVSYCLAAVCVGAIGIVGTTVATVMATVFVAGFFVIGTQFCMNALAASSYPTAVRATGVGWALGIGRIGSVLGPVIGGLLLSLGWGNAALFFVAAMPALVSAIAVAWLRTQTRAGFARG